MSRKFRRSGCVGHCVGSVEGFWAPPNRAQAEQTLFCKVLGKAPIGKFLGAEAGKLMTQVPQIQCSGKPPGGGMVNSLDGKSGSSGRTGHLVGRWKIC